MSPPASLVLLTVLAGLAGLAIGSRTRRLVVLYAVPDERLPDERLPDERLPDERLSGETVPGGTVSGETVPGKTAPGERASEVRRPARSRPAAGAVEAATATVLAALALRALWPGLPAGTGVTTAGRAGELLAFGWLAVVAVVLVFVDVAVHRLPDRLTLAAYLGTAAPLAASALADGRLADLLGAGLGGLALAGFYLVLFLINPAGMGLGDVKFAGSLGTALGWLGWDTLVTGAFLGLAAGGLYGAALLLLRRAGRESEIPFGPFMAAGTLAAVLTAL
ncbi:prepilin peptidase [Streptosporangium sp. DT93]|uniref:prepilin peptidase n=1 Tax=Streptosporangium sp. DT93 TaxID=3393428 RepID=UPI003CFADCBD